MRADPQAAPPAPLVAEEAPSVFRLPHWFMSIEEWELLLRASERTQQPVLRTALQLTSLFAEQTANSAAVRLCCAAPCRSPTSGKLSLGLPCNCLAPAS